ncbi:MAG: SLC13 family permease [Pseudomonadota bacterium]
MTETNEELLLNVNTRENGSDGTPIGQRGPIVKGEVRARTSVQWAGLAMGTGIFFLLLVSPNPEGLSREAMGVAALASLMIIWWVTEAIPIAVTALAPMIVLPLAGVSPLKEAATSYMSPIVVLLMAGFIIAKAIEKWGLHTRIALNVVRALGTQPGALIAGFMIAAAGLSMWISNTATALMMMPIALSVAEATKTERLQQRDGAVGVKLDRRFGLENSFTTALLLSVAYACSIGGLATPVGSPTNLIVIGYLAEQNIALGFADWMRLGVPVVLLLLPVAWLILVRYGVAGSSCAEPSGQAKKIVQDGLMALGPITEPEKRTLIVFLCIASAWVFSAQLKNLPGLDALNDQIIGLVGVVAFFIIPSGARQQAEDDGERHPRSIRSSPLLDWSLAERIPWGVILLFGGGLSLAAAIGKSGLALFLAQSFVGLGGMPDFIVILALTVLVLMLTEFTSNVATVSAILPMVGAIALATGFDLVALAAPIGLAASCAFMLPMATGPNAVAYAADHVPLRRMANIGIRLNIAGALIITLVATVLR